MSRLPSEKSFTTRRVVAVQEGEAIFSLEASFHVHEEGYDHQDTMPAAPEPDTLRSEREMAIARRKQEMQLAPIETRLIPVSYASAGDIQDRAKDLLSERGSIAVDERTNVMLLAGVRWTI